MPTDSFFKTVLDKLRPRRRAEQRNIRPDVSEPRFVRLSELIGEPISQPSLYDQALRHRSLLRRRTDTRLISNERLEFLGDAVLGMVVAEHLYMRYRGEHEGFLTKMRAKIVNGKSLARYAKRVDLGELIQMSENMSGLKGRTNDTILADAYEALIGAIYLDKGLPTAKGFIHTHLLAQLDLELLSQTQDNYKSALQEFAQARGWPQPRYTVTEETGPSHNKEFVIVVEINGEHLGSGKAGNKKMAQQLAAREALHVLDQRERE